MRESLAATSPLALFTTAVCVAVGLAVAAAGAQSAPRSEPAFYMLWSFGLGVAGLLASTAHLGKPGRFLLAAMGLGRSWLSREVILVTLFVTAAAAAALALFGVFPPRHGPLLTYCAAALGLLTTLVIGIVYRLEGQLSWVRPSQVFAPPVAAALLAATILAQWHGLAWALAAAWAALAADSALLAARHSSVGSLSDRKELSHPDLRAAVRCLMFLRCLALPVATAALLALSAPAAPFSVVAALVADRLIFYAAAAQDSPAAQMARARAERMAAAIQTEGQADGA